MPTKDAIVIYQEFFPESSINFKLYYKIIHLTALAELDSMGKGVIFKHINDEWEKFLNTKQVKDLLKVTYIDNQTRNSLVSLIEKFKLHSDSGLLTQDMHHPGAFRNYMLHFRRGLPIEQEKAITVIKNSSEFKERNRWHNRILNIPNPTNKRYNIEGALEKKITEWKALGTPLSSFNPVMTTPGGDFDWNKRSSDDRIIYPYNKFIIYKTPNILESGVQKIVTDVDMNIVLVNSITTWYLRTVRRLGLEN